MRRGIGTTTLALLLALGVTASASAQLPLPGATGPTGATGTTGSAAPAVAPGPPADATTARYGDASRRNWVAGGVAPPLGVLWRTPLGGTADYPLIADGKVFVDRTRSATDYGSVVMALDARTGKTLWSTTLQHVYFTADIAYAAGRVLTADPDGKVTALDAATGQVQWTAATSSSAGPPAVAGDLVIVQSEGKLTALALSTGVTRWTAPLQNSYAGTPAVSGDRVYASADCKHFAFDRASGTQIWASADAACERSTRMVAFGDRVGAGARVENAQDGSVAAGLAPDVATDTALIRRESSGGLTAFAPNGTDGLWSAKDTPAELLGVGGSLFGVATDGTFTLRDARTGAMQWTAKLRGGGISDSGVSGIGPTPAAGGGLVIEPVGADLVALAPVAQTPATPLTLTRTKSVNHAAGATLTLRGTAPGPFVRTVGLQVDEAPFGAFASRGKPLVDTEKPTTTLHLLANTRVRFAAADGAVSNVQTFYAFPGITFTGERRGRTRATERFGVVGRRVAGRRLALYAVRPASHTATRIGLGRIHRAGSARGAATVRFRYLRKVGRRDYLLACVEHAERYGMGRRDFLQARCGRRSFRF